MRNMMDLCAVIMAGGIGTRFWPLSRKKKPKQFLPIISESTMIEETVNRILPKIPVSRIYTVANSQQTQAIKAFFPDIPEENLLIEPQGKNTAPCLLLASAVIHCQNPEAVVAVLPADHFIQDRPLFLKKLEAAAAAAEQTQSLLTFGIPPTYPATGYGYINFSPNEPSRFLEENFFPVNAFKEKPDYEVAKTFLQSGDYFWNSGMFIWPTRIFEKKIEQFAPVLYAQWIDLLEAVSQNDEEKIASIYSQLPSTSIDYALMEKAEGVLMGEGDFGWSDVGAWSSLYPFWPKDESNNVSRGESILLDAENCLIYNPQKLTALIGVKDLIVVNTEDALLVCRKDQDQRVKDIVEKIKKEKKDEYL
jgi:mannose-1-phosphate guanylyltransferase